MEFNERDLFAGLAMCGQLANAHIKEQTTYEELAIASYQIAEWMIHEKEKRDATRSVR